MATTAPAPIQVSLSASTAGTFHVPQITPESAKAASELLQENHVKNHIFFNSSRFHNHIAHNLLTYFALGANPNQIQRAYDQNDSYQRPQRPLQDADVELMASSRDKLASFYGDEKRFRDFEEFYGREIEKHGVKATLDEWLFKGDDVANSLLYRMFAGAYHPIIHFGFGLEFHQPAILVEALAQAAVHEDYMTSYLVSCEEKAASRSTQSSPSLISLLQQARQSPQISSSVRYEDGNKIREGVLGRAAQPMIDLASQWTVQPTLSDLRFKTAEMIQCGFYFTASALHPRKIPKFDFFYMHVVNASIFYSSFVDDPENRKIFGLSDGGGDGDGDASPNTRKSLVRLLEMKARTDLAMYVSRGCPELYVDRITEYQRKNPDQGWKELFERACRFEDDGHTSKLVRAVANASNVCAEFENDARVGDWKVKGQDMWLNIGHMVMDSVEEHGGKRENWVRNVGFEQAWAKVPDRVLDGRNGKL